MATVLSSVSVLCLVVVCCLVAASSAGDQNQRRPTVRKTGAASPRTIASGPINVAVLAGSSATLNCQADVAANEPRVEWIEYVTLGGPVYISDGTFLVESHPNYARYTLITDVTQRIYNLGINPTVAEDAGVYECRDANVDDSRKAQLVILNTLPNCTTTLPEDGIVTEGTYHTIECEIFYKASPGIAPTMTWTGPGEFGVGDVITDVSVWAGVQFYVSTAMDGRSFKCVTNFTQVGFGGEANMATNAPTWSSTFTSQMLFVQYGPKNVTYSPILPEYEIDTVLTCYSDAVPLPTYKWTNMLTLVDYDSQSLTISADMVGDLVLRCQVVNSVSTANLFVNITVKPHTTPPPSTTTTTGTTMAPVAHCDDLTGRWEAVRDATSSMVLCLNVDTTLNGLIRGMIQNDTNEPYLTELIGRTRADFFDEAGFTGIWPDRIGVSSYAAECHKCFGVEIMYVNVISRSSLDAQFCEGGTVLESPQYKFTRKPMGYPCSMSMAEMEENLMKAPRPRRAH